MSALQNLVLQLRRDQFDDSDEYRRGWNAATRNAIRHVQALQIREGLRELSQTAPEWPGVFELSGEGG